MDEKILLRVWPEFGSSGIWMPPIAREPPAGKNVSYESLQLSDDLADAFMQWQECYNDRPLPDDGTFDWESFHKEGLVLSKKLKMHMLDKADVEYTLDNKFQKIYAFKVMADYSASIWIDNETAYDLWMIEEEFGNFLFIDRKLFQKKFYEWEALFSDCAKINGGWEEFNLQGEELVNELQNSLPQNCVVWYKKTFEETYPPFKAVPTTI